MVNSFNNDIKIKPIQATPTLSGTDAKAIIEQVSVKPSQKAIERNRRILALRKNNIDK